jgi:hypothetical protein
MNLACGRRDSAVSHGQRQAEADVHDPAQYDRPDAAGEDRADADYLVTDVSWDFRVKKGLKTFKPRKADAPDGTWRLAQRDIDRVQEFRKCIDPVTRLLRMVTG